MPPPFRRDASSYNRSVWVADGMGTLVSENDPSGMLRKVVDAMLSSKVRLCIGCTFSVPAVCNVDALVSAAVKMFLIWRDTLGAPFGCPADRPSCVALPASPVSASRSVVTLCSIDISLPPWVARHHSRPRCRPWECVALLIAMVKVVGSMSAKHPYVCRLLL